VGGDTELKLSVKCGKLKLICYLTALDADITAHESKNATAFTWMFS